MMPWASDGIAGYKAIGQRTHIVATGHAAGEPGIAAPSDQESLAVSVALHHAAVGANSVMESPSAKWGPVSFFSSAIRSPNVYVKPRSIVAPLPAERNEELLACCGANLMYNYTSSRLGIRSLF
jgi:hypothetical protein